MARKQSRTEESEEQTPAIVNLSADDVAELAEAMGVPALLSRIDEQEQTIAGLEQAFTDLAIYANRLHEMYMRVIGEPMVSAKIQGSFSNGSFQLVRDRSPNVPARIIDPTTIRRENDDPVLKMVKE